MIWLGLVWSGPVWFGQGLGLGLGLGVGLGLGRRGYRVWMFGCGCLDVEEKG